MRPYNYGLANASFLLPGDTVIVNNLLARVVEKTELAEGFSLTFEAEELGDELDEGWPVKRRTITEEVPGDHTYPFIFFVNPERTFEERKVR